MKRSEAVTGVLVSLPALIAAGAAWLQADAAKRSEARLRLRHKWIAVEPRLWLGHHSTSDQLGGPSYGADMLMGWAR